MSCIPAPLSEAHCLYNTVIWQQDFGLDFTAETLEKRFSFQGCLILIPALSCSEELFS